MRDSAIRAAQSAATGSFGVDPMIVAEESGGAASGGGGGYHGYDSGDGGSTAFRGNDKDDSKFVQSERFSFSSGDYSNVVVTVDDEDKSGGSPKIKIDVYYV